MFGVHDSGDTSGFGGLRLPAYSPAPASAPTAAGSTTSPTSWAPAWRAGHPRQRDPPGTVDRGEITLYVHRTGSSNSAGHCGIPRVFAIRAAVQSVRGGLRRGGRDRLHVVYHLLSMTTQADPAGGLGHRGGPALPSVVEVYRQRLAGRETWTCSGDLRRSPGADPDPDAGRLGWPPTAQGLPARRHRSSTKAPRYHRPTSGGLTREPRHEHGMST